MAGKPSYTAAAVKRIVRPVVSKDVHQTTAQKHRQDTQVRWLEAALREQDRELEYDAPRHAPHCGAM